MRRTVCTVNQDATPKPSGNIMSKFAIFCCSLLALIMLAVTVDTADAARFGGGRSFGGRSFMSRPATPPASTFNQSRVTRETPQAAAAAQRPGMGGIFGGLLAGTLLGSLFGGMGGGVIGGILNILILGGLVYLAFRLFARLRGARRNTEQESATLDRVFPVPGRRRSRHATQRAELGSAVGRRGVLRCAGRQQRHG